MSDDPSCAKCGHPRSNHPHRHPFVGPSRDQTIKEQRYRIEELEAKLEKKDGCLEETYRRWKNGADLRALAKAEGCTQDRMRHKMKRYEEDKVRLLEDKLAKAAEALEWCAKADHSIMARFALAELKGKSDGL